jgi:hypothetical protein
MELPINAKVRCSDGPCGQSTRVILKPTTEEITHVVVCDTNAIQETEYLVPVNQITESSPKEIQLKCSRAELEKMPVFSTVHFVPSTLTGFMGNRYMMWPYYPVAIATAETKKSHIPADELAIRRGAKVNAVEGHVGQVDEFLINPTNDQITHLVLREGHLWGQKDVTIPVSQIDHYQDNTVFLKLTKLDIEKLPGVPVRRSGK